MDKNNITHGLLVIKIDPNYINNIPLKLFDVLLKIENYDIDSDGFIELRKHERVNICHLFNIKQVGENLNVTILRDSKIQQLQLPMVSSTYDFLVPNSWFGSKKFYKIYGGLVITYFTEEFLQNQSENNRYTDYPPSSEYPKQQHIIITQILEHEINRGHDIFEPIQLISINDNCIHNMDDVETQIKLSQDLEFIRFKLKNNRFIVLDVQEVKLREHEIFEQHGIAMDCRPL
jgi:hypothetical protein